MLDGKILVAVLVSLAAISAGIDGSSIESVNSEDLKENTENINSGGFNFDFQGMLSNPLSKIKDSIKNRPEPTSSMSATLDVESLSSEDINIQKADLEADNFTSMSLGSQEVDSDEVIRLYGFTGTLKPGSVTEISGSAKGLLSSDVNVSGFTNVEERIETKELRLTDVRRSSLAFSDVKGQIASSNASIEFGSSRTLEINSFSGNLTIEPEENKVIIEGKVDSLNAGDFGFGN